MTLEDEYKILIGGYFGVQEMDEYGLKVYVLKDIEDYTRKFIKNNPLVNYDYLGLAEDIKNNLPLKRKLQDSLLVLRKIKGPLELELMIKERLSEMKNGE